MESAPLLSHQKAIDDFPRHQRQEYSGFGRRIEEPDQSHEGVQQVPIQEADIDGPHIPLLSRVRVTGLKPHAYTHRNLAARRLICYTVSYHKLKLRLGARCSSSGRLEPHGSRPPRPGRGVLLRNGIPPVRRSLEPRARQPTEHADAGEVDGRADHMEVTVA
jgi:hypothetical protein